MVSFNNWCDVACLKFSMWRNNWLFKNHPLSWGKKCTFHQMHEFCILQGTVATFFKCGGQVQKHLFWISSGFRVSKIIQICLFLTELFKQEKCGSTLWDTLYNLSTPVTKWPWRSFSGCKAFRMQFLDHFMRFQMIQCVARSLSDSWSSCCYMQRQIGRSLHHPHWALVFWRLYRLAFFRDL